MQNSYRFMYVRNVGPDMPLIFAYFFCKDGLVIAASRDVFSLAVAVDVFVLGDVHKLCALASGIKSELKET